MDPHQSSRQSIKQAAQAKQASKQSTKEGISVRRPLSSRLQMGFPCYHATGYPRGLSLPHRFRQLGLDFPIFHRPPMRPETWGTSFLSCVGRRSQRSLGERTPRAERVPLPVFFNFLLPLPFACLCLFVSLVSLSRNSLEHVVQGRQCRSPALPFATLLPVEFPRKETRGSTYPKPPSVQGSRSKHRTATARLSLR
jgi:hypothetical protein